jgi:hypothetical protein
MTAKERKRKHPAEERARVEGIDPALKDRTKHRKNPVSTSEASAEEFK